ncbi:MAG: response regulator [Desulfosarcina sp.]|nr:response regulator [Desulfosarcina sp.]
MLLNRKTVLIVDPSPIFRRKLKVTIQTNETPVDVIEADNTGQAEVILSNQQIDVVFLDIGFPQEQVVQLIDAIDGAAGDMRLVVLAGHDAMAAQAAGLRDRADAFLPKEQAVGLRLADVIREMIRRS